MTYDAASGTAVIGSGLTWDTVYARLEKHGVSVLGGRVGEVSGRRDSISWSILNPVTYQVGVGGLLLGGGWFLEILCCFVH